MDELWQLKPIGHMKSVFHFKNGTPRQPAVCSHALGSVTIDKSVFNNPEHSLEGLGEFSHVWVLFLFHKNNNTHTKAKVKPPRLDGRRVGVFSTRSPYRPNAIGLTLAAIDKIQGATVYLKGIDILDGTPILDIKPYIPDYDAPGVLQHLDLEGAVSNVDFPRSNIPATCDNNENNVAAEVCQDLVRDPNQASSLCTDSSSISKDDEQIDLEHVDFSCGDKFTNNYEDINLSSKKTTRMYEKKQNSETLATEHLGDEPGALSSQGDVTPDGLSTSSITESSNDAQTLREKNVPGLARKEENEANSTVKTANWVSKSTVRKLDVRFTPTAMEQLQTFSPDNSDSVHKLHLFSSVSEVEAAIHQVLNEDPRSVYRRNKCKDSLYFFAIDTVHVTCWFDECVAEVVRIQPVAGVPQCSE